MHYSEFTSPEKEIKIFKFIYIPAQTEVKSMAREFKYLLSSATFTVFTFVGHFATTNVVLASGFWLIILTGAGNKGIEN